MVRSTDSEEEITDFDVAGETKVKTRNQSEKKRRQRRLNKSVIGLISPPQDTISLSGTLKRGLKLGQVDAEGKSLNNALRRELKSSVSAHSNSLKRGESLQNVSVLDDYPLSPRSPNRWGFSMRKKKDEDTVSLSSVFGPKSPKMKNPGKNKVLRPDEAQYVYDDTVSMLEGLLVDTSEVGRPEEGIRDSIGRKMPVTLKKMIKLGRGQGDHAKVDAKVLTLTPDRCFILGVKSPFKIESNFHFLDIKAMDSPAPDRLIISTTNGKIYLMQMIGTDDADHIIGRVALSLRTIFPGVSLSKILKASLEPLSRQKVIQSMLNQADMNESGPCGNFSVMYECMCNFMGLPVREEVGWDVDTIYLSQNCRDLNFKDFDLSDQKDFMPIIALLTYNKWFEGLIIRNIRLSSEVFDTILKVVRRSSCLKKLVLEGTGLKGDIAHKMSQEMIENKECSISILDLANNPLEDRAIMHLSGSLPLLRNGGGLRILNLDRTGLTAKGVSGLCQALRSSPIIGRTLTKLTLADNAIKGEEAIGLYNYLSTKNHLEHLDVSGTDCAVEIYISAMSKGCLDHLKTINLSKNHFFGKGISARPPHYIEDEYTGNRKNKEIVLPNTFQEYFKTTKALADLDLSGMRVPPEAVRQIMDGLCHNFCEDLKVNLNLSGTELRAAGAQTIGAVVGHLTNLVGLDLSDNGLDSDLSSLLAWIQQNDSIRELKIGRNFNNIKPKNTKAVMDSIVELVQKESSVLENLSLAESKLREWSNILLGCLGSNTSLTTLDISGNMMGDTGARHLSKALQINSKIKVLLLDRNLLSANAFNEISTALEKNYTLRYLPYPVNDAVAAMKSQPDRTQSSLAKIQDLLLRNANTNRNSNEQQFRLQRAVTCTAQEVLDRVAGKVDDAVNALELLEADTACSDVVIKAKGLVKDAKNSKQLLSDIYGLGMEKTSGDHSHLRRKLDEMAREMDAMVQEHIKNTVQTMTKSAESQCPHIFEEISDEIEDKSKERSHLPKEFVKDHVIKQTGTEIINKVSELNLTVATLISDKVTDTLLAALSQCNTTLTEQVNKKKREQALAREEEYNRRSQAQAKENDVEKIQIVLPTDSSADEELENREEKKPKPTDNILPAMRKERAASVAKRKQRPISSAPNLEYKKKEDPPLSTPPRSSSPIIETPVKKTEPTEEEEKETEKDEKLTVEKEEEPVYAKLNKKKKIDEKTEDQEEDKEENKRQEVEEEQKSEEMVKDEESKEETKEDEDDSGDLSEEIKEEKIEIDLPELSTTSKKLEHVTKGRPRPNRRPQRKPVSNHTETDAGVDTFFTASVESTNFENVPTLKEEREQAKKEAPKKTPKKPAGVAMPGMPMLTPDMLKRKKKPSGDDKEKEEEKQPESPKKSDDEKNEAEEEAKSPEPAVKRRPPGAMGLPGMSMGFGTNMLQEMKLKKLHKTKSSEPNHDKNEENKNSSDKQALPFGPGMLKKTHPVTSLEKSEVNNNNSNNNTGLLKSPTLNRWKSKSFDKKEKPDITVKTAGKSPLMPKPSPPSKTLKPSSLKGKPPPLPSKPKPAALRPDSDLKGGRARPMSEFVDPKDVPTSVRLRATSWGKKDQSSKSQENKK